LPAANVPHRCGEKKQARVNVPHLHRFNQRSRPKLLAKLTAAIPEQLTLSPKPRSLPTKKNTDEESTAEEQDVPSLPADTKPILVETGLASWYGAPYHNRRGSNGEIYNMNAMTAAHRTLPLVDRSRH